ncbi:hypothetical protein CP533_3132 [Ophiocordyceps camponoti-saundersi (nom. inval.)]|nr:hypothetical protein CP533_3132 [Ophiocordyceps camponoti-saundersi (nom. inval.)]
MAPSGDPSRLRHGLSPLSTGSPGRQVADQSTPGSTGPIPVSHSHSLGGLIQPYNPREWASPPASTPTPPPPERARQSDVASRASAPPPPPYSPPRARRQRPVSTAFEYALPSAASPPPRNILPSSLAKLRLSPEPQTVPGFLPPPEATRPGGSRDRRFGLPTLGRRPDNDRLSSSLDQQMPTMLSMGPLAPPSEPARMASAHSITPQALPPAARRAASTGAIGTVSSGRSRPASRSGWEPGMPLPPPPPGPPPPGSRSQSVQGVDRNSTPVISPPTRRLPPSGISSLGPIPPTPAGWVHEDAEPCRPDRGRPSGLTIDTRVATGSREGPEPQLLSPGSGALLNRAGAVRLDKTIIQRRAESRVRNSSSPRGSSDAGKISDIVVSIDADSPGPLTTKSNPRGGLGIRSQAGTSRPGEPSASSSKQLDSRNSTPRASDSARLSLLEASTPPFSPVPAKADQSSSHTDGLVPKALPTPPPQIRSASSSRPFEDTHHPARDKAPAPQHMLLAQSSEQFAIAAVERFRVFATQEAAATTDADRVRMFADFIVSESRIRRERYSTAIGAMGSEILDLTRDLFRPMVATSATRRPSNSWGNWTPDSSSGLITSPGGIASVLSGDGMSTSAPTSAKLPVTPKDDQPPGSGNNANRAANYMPCLSPILSMSVSDNHENGSSRGRPSSRWWESDFQGDERRPFERSRRESKYMGVSKDQWAREEQDAATQRALDESHPSPEYPPEKTDWHGREQRGLPESQGNASYPVATPSLKKPQPLDVSRLVTLPPPYPRHHPAVNNNHPDLAAIRSSVRLLSDLSEVSEAKEGFTIASSSRREAFAQAARERQHSLRANLQEEIMAGNLGYSDAAAIESDSQNEEKDKEKEFGKTEYENFQNEVVLPLNEILTGRISRATDMFEHLSRHLFDNGLMDADMPQEEGDDRPELLEKLTLLKWVFEMRETLHRAIYDILSDRNRRYREVVEAPYRLVGNTEKLKSAEAFFAQDAAWRAHAYAKEMLDRTRQLQTVVEEAVERGVALQLSAFWDIAPPLRQLLDSIPDELEGFGVQVPPSELEENPSYYQHPLQYLYSLLQHAEKSTHQFIESHTNLLCLLHEVKGAVVKARARAWATQVGEGDGVQEQADTMRRSEDMRLTEDLKDKVREVQDQWNSALGDDIKSVKERTGAWLLQRGGWDEALEESQAYGGV